MSYDFDDIEEMWHESRDGYVVHYKITFLEHHLRGSIDRAIAVLAELKRLAPNAEIATGRGYDDQWLEVTWTRVPYPEEMAKRERDQREAAARRAAERAAEERREFERLKAKFGGGA